MTFFIKIFHRCKRYGIFVFGNGNINAGGFLGLIFVLYHRPLDFVTFKTSQPFRIECQCKFFTSVSIKQEVCIFSAITVFKVYGILHRVKSKFFFSNYFPVVTFFYISLCKNRHTDLSIRFSLQLRETCAIFRLIDPLPFIFIILGAPADSLCIEILHLLFNAPAICVAGSPQQEDSTLT